MTPTTSESFFDAKYREAADPWQFATNRYELDRYQQILKLLLDRRFNLAYEPGCSIGVLTEHLASRCEAVKACDISGAAAERARTRCQNLKNVEVFHAALYDFIPQNADLYVFCEVGYYMQPAELAELLETHIAALCDEATLVACHWRGESPDHLISGDKVHQAIHDVRGLMHEYSEQNPEFRLDRWVKRKADRCTPSIT